MSSAMPEDQDCNMGDTDVEAPDLPIEIIVHILSFLHTPDRKDASLVCRRWYHASQESQFQNSTTFRFPASAWSVDLLRGLGQRSRCSLAISQLDGISSSRNLLLEVGLCLGSRLEGLALPGSSLTEASLLGLLPRLTALRRLDLRGLDSLFMSGAFLSREEHRRQVGQALSGLEELDLSDLRYLSDLTFNRLTGCTPRLRRLSLAGCHIAFEFDPYAGVPLAPGRDSSALLSLRNLRRLLAEQSGTLTGLDLSRTAITPESLRTVAQVPGLSLEELVLQGCKELTDPSVEVLVRHQGGLRRLDLSGCTGLSSRAAQAIALGLGELRELSLARAWRLTEKGLSDLVALPSLRRLDLSECVHVSGVELVRGLSGPGRPPAQLETLRLRSCSYLGDAAVCLLARLLGPSLRELDLSSCVWLTDVSVRTIATCLRRLVVLRLAWCKELTDWGLLGLTGPSEETLPPPQTDDKGPTFTRTFGNMGFFQPPSLPCEERLPVVTEQELEQFRHQQGASLLALSRLQELDLSGCCKLTDTSLSQVVRHLDLRSLSLSVLPRLSDAGLASVARHCPGLTRLALSRCPGLSNHGLEHAAPHLHRLQHLLLAGCDNITDRSLHVLMQHCQRLRTLDVSMCNHISIATVDLVQSQLPFLESVQCRHVGGSDLSLTSLTSLTL